MNETKTITVKEESNQRLDTFLLSCLENYSRSHIQKLISEGNVLVNNAPSKASYKTRMNDIIVVNIPSLKFVDIKCENIPLDIVYQDEDILIINKPVGLVVHPANGNWEHTLVNALMYHVSDLSGINGELRPGIVHRIDKDTSGLLVVAKNDFAHNHLADQIKNHTMKRHYACLVVGTFSEDNGKIIAPIGRDKNDRKKMCVDIENGKHAVTYFHVEKRYNQHTLLLCALETGRTHQIRVHMDYIGHPIVGDNVYGKGNKRLYKDGQLLHAYQLTLVHPRTNKEMVFNSPIPAHFADILKSLEYKN